MSSDLFLPKIPKQTRSLKRFEKILNASEKLLEEENIHALTLKKIAKKGNFKRSSIYKFFPNVLSILYALSERHVKKITKIFKNNISNVEGQSLDWYLNIFIDVLSIYFNTNKVTAILILTMQDLPSANLIEKQNRRLLTTSFLQLTEKDDKYTDDIEVLISIEIALTILSLSYKQEAKITARMIAEAKRASLAYLFAKNRVT